MYACVGTRYEFPLKKLSNIQAVLEKLISKNYYLHRSAREAYRSYLLSYASHALKHIFDVHNIDPVSYTHLTLPTIYSV